MSHMTTIANSALGCQKAVPGTVAAPCRKADVTVQGVPARPSGAGRYDVWAGATGSSSCAS